MRDKKFAIIGLGLIGGSLAKAFRQRLGVHDIIAVDKCAHSIEQAVNDGIISCGFTEIGRQVWSSDFIFVCTPVKEITGILDMAAENAKPGCIITDVGSTKAGIIDFVSNMDAQFCFIGGHPMAGTEKTGYSSSFAHLFENAYYILTPCRNVQQASIDILAGLVKGIGGIPVILEADEHDKIAAGISHVPHLIASALVNLVKEMDGALDGKMQMLAAGGFKDITRIASSSPEIWESIILSNKQEAENVLEAYIDILKKIKSSVNLGDSDSIYSFFETARNYRKSFSSTKKGLIAPLYDIIVDVVDKPGIIGKIATLLGSSNVNIKNINVSNSREFEQGCLRITLPDPESACKALDILGNSGYKAFYAS
jgi:prephenate dehydrogenase